MVGESLINMMLLRICSQLCEYDLTTFIGITTMLFLNSTLVPPVRHLLIQNRGQRRTLGSEVVHSEAIILNPVISK